MEPMLKSQTVRLVDVAIIGPSMIWAAADLRQKRPWLAGLLAVFGVATIGYNAVNYQRYRTLAAAANTPPVPQPAPQAPPPAEAAPSGAWA